MAAFCQSFIKVMMTMMMMSIVHSRLCHAAVNDQLANDYRTSLN